MVPIKQARVYKFEAAGSAVIAGLAEFERVDASIYI